MRTDGQNDSCKLSADLHKGDVAQVHQHTSILILRYQKTLTCDASPPTHWIREGVVEMKTYLAMNLI